jgi:chromosome segregation ATPase
MSYLHKSYVDIFSEIFSLREELEAAKAKHQATQADKRAALEAAELTSKATEKEHQLAIVALEKAAKEKEQDYKTKIQQLEKVFDKLQARIEELQSKKREEAASCSSEQVLGLEARLERTEADLAKQRRKETELKGEVATLLADKEKLTASLNKLEKKARFSLVVRIYF